MGTLADASERASGAEENSVSIVLSFRNEADVLDELIRRTEAALDQTGVEYEIIFVNDDSTDDSEAILLRHVEKDPHIRLVNMSSRFGVIPCVYAGMAQAMGDAVVTMDCDLQDPPEFIPKMITAWKGGANVVNTTRTARRGEPAIKLLLTRLGYALLKAAAEIELPVETGMFKLMDRRVVNALLEIGEQDPYMRGLITWVGFKQERLYYEREERFAGETHFPLFSSNPIREFSIGLISFSKIPLASILAAGLGVTGLTLCTLFIMSVSWVFGADLGPAHFGFALLVLLAGMQLLAMGILGLYVGRTYRQTRGRPHYIIESRQGFPEKPAA